MGFSWTARRLAALVVAVIAVTAFVLLGLWQLRRYEEKKQLRDEVAAAVAAPPRSLDDVDASDIGGVTISGVYDTSLEAIVLRSRRGVSGYHVLTPLVAESGAVVLVDRGWVPIDNDAAPVAAAAPPAGRVDVVGVLWPAERGDRVVDLPGPVDRIDPALLAPYVDGEIVESYLVLQGQEPASGDVPLMPEVPTIALGPHLGYAGQWFLFALVVVVGFPLWLRRGSVS